MCSEIRIYVLDCQLFVYIFIKWLKVWNYGLLWKLTYTVLHIKKLPISLFSTFCKIDNWVNDTLITQVFQIFHFHTCDNFKNRKFTNVDFLKCKNVQFQMFWKLQFLIIWHSLPLQFNNFLTFHILLKLEFSY